MKEFLGIARQFIGPNPHRYAIMEGNRDCNRRCGYCDVPNQYARDTEPTVEEACGMIDWFYNNGFRTLSYVGGEPLAAEPFVTREGLTFFEHTRRLVAYAHKKGMAIGVVTNGDFVNEEMINALGAAGLDSLGFSLHSLSRDQVEARVKLARFATKAKIVPTINTVLTTRSADIMPGLAAYTARNGVPFSLSLVQEKGGGFSRKNRVSLLPSLETQRKVFSALLRLKQFGFIKTSRGYMQHAPDFYPNNWRCNPEKDSFIHLDAEGHVNVCQDMRTGIKMAELDSLSDERWRTTKKVLVQNCGNCLYLCFYDCENLDPIGHLPFVGVGMLIRTGNAAIAEKWGRFAVEMCKRLERDVEWEMGI